MGVNVAFLGKGWRLARVVPASDVYCDSETAVWDLCEGCANERGWLAMDGSEQDPICPWMREAGEYNGRPMVGIYEGPNNQRFRQCVHWQEPKPKTDKQIRAEGQMALF